MSSIDRSRTARFRILLVIPLLLGLGGCVAAPLIGVATSGFGNAAATSAMQAPLARAGAPTDEVAQVPATSPGGSASTCDQAQSGATSSGCSAGAVGTAMQGLATSLQNLLPAALMAH